MSISLRAMRYFTMALRLGSITRASEALNVSASAISAAIDRIEDHFALQLTDRQRARGIVATADGHVMARKFNLLLEEYDGVLRDGVDLKQSLRGELRVGYYAPVAPAFLPQILAPLLRPENELTLHLEACDNSRALEGLRRGAFDAVLCVSEGAEPGLRFDPLVTAPAYCLMSGEHPMAARETVALADLAGQDIVALNRPFAGEYYAALFAQAGVRPRVVAQTNSTEMVRSLVGAGRACALLNMVPLTKVSYGGDRLAARPISDDLPPLVLCVGYRDAQPRRAVTEFVTQCKAHFVTPEPWLCPMPQS